MKLRIALGFSTLLLCGSAHALMNVCDLASREIGATTETASKISAYKENLGAECSLASAFQTVSATALQQYSITPEQITIYQALRFISRDTYESARSRDSVLTLGGSIAGIGQMEVEKSQIANGSILAIEDLVRIHNGFNVLNSTTSTATTPQATEPGVLREPTSGDLHGWKLSADQVRTVKSTTRDMNEAFAAYGFAKSGMESLYEPLYVNEILSVRRAADGDGDALYFSDSRATGIHLVRFLKFVNAMFDQARRGQHMVWHDRLMTPGQFGLLAKQYYAAIHPFREDNGLVGSLIQELIFTSFGLPHGASGEMQTEDTVLLRPDVYYARSMAKTRDLVQAVQGCVEQTYPTAVARNTPPVEAIVAPPAVAAKPERRSSKHDNAAPVFDVPQVVVTLPAPRPPELWSLSPTEIDYGCRLIR